MREKLRSWALRGLALVAGVVGLTWLTDDLWAVPMIVSAPSAHGAQEPRVPDDVRRHLRVTRGDVSLDARVFDPTGAVRGTVLILHGIRSSQRPMAHLARELAAKDARAVTLDLRGHGASTGEHLTYGAEDRLDVAAVVDALEAEELLTPPLVLHGTSYGTATALLHAADDPRVDAVVAIAPYSSLREVVPDYVRYGFGPIAALMPDAWIQSVVTRAGRTARFDPARACPACDADAIRVPVFLAHGDADRRIGPAHGARIAARLPSVTRLVFPGATHDTIARASRGDALEFLDTQLLALE